MKEKIVQWGKPSLVFGWGQEKRLNLVKKYINFEGKKILDVGCGIGIYSKKFFKEGGLVFGVDIDEEKIKQAKKLLQK